MNYFNEIFLSFQLLATDFCGRFIEACFKLQKGESVEYSGPEEGAKLVAKISPDIIKDNLVFKQVQYTFIETYIINNYVETVENCNLNSL